MAATDGVAVRSSALLPSPGQALQLCAPQTGRDHQQADQQSRRQRPDVQGLGHTGLGWLLRCRLETIQRVSDRLQLCARRGAEILTAGLLGNGAQRRLVEVQARVETEAAERATFFRHGADADGVDTIK